MRRFFDTNVLVYAFGRQDAVKRDLARALIEEATADESFVLSTQVLAEFYSTAVRTNVMGPTQARDLVRVWAEHDTVPHTADLVLRGISLHQQHSLSFWDAMIVQAALDARCDVLLTEDLQHGRRFGNLEVANPFLAPAGVHEPRARSSGASKTPRGGKSKGRRRS